MATSNVNLPPGYTLDSPQASASLPEGYTIDPPGQDQTQTTSSELTANPDDSMLTKGAKAVGGVFEGLGEGLFDTAATGSDLIDKATGMKQGTVNQFLHNEAGDNEVSHGTAQNIGRGLENIIEFAMGDEAIKGLSLSERLAQGSKLADILEKYPSIANMLGGAVRTGSVGATVGGIHGGAGGAVAGGVGGALAGGIGGAMSAGASEEPGIIQKVLKGQDVAQPSAQNAVRSAVTTAAENTGTATDEMLSKVKTQPIINNGSTVVDDHLAALRAAEKDAYQKMDDAAGMDVAAERKQLANDQYKLKNLGNTDADVTQRGNLIVAINESEQRIADAEQKLQDAGIDPKAADTLHQQRMAGMEFKKALVQSTQPDGSVNVDKLINASKNLRFSKYGDRLSQFFGSEEAADGYMAELGKSQAIGVHALKAQKVASTIAKIVGSGVIGGEMVHVASRLLK